MTARERMRTALARGKPDRVPIALVGDIDFYCKAADRPLWELEYGDNAAVVEILRDSHLRFPLNDYIRSFGFDHESVASRRVVVECGVPYLEDRHTGKRTPIQERKTAARWDTSGYRPTSHWGYTEPVNSEAEIQKLLGPVLDREALLRSGVFDPTISLREQLGDNVYLSHWAGGLFYQVLDLMGGFERGMASLLEKPDLARALMEHLAWRSIPEMQAAAQAGADAIWIGGYVEGADLISPRLWRTIALPGHRVQVEGARAAGLQILFWFLGDCMPLLEDLVELGIDGLVLEQDRRGYCSDPVTIRKQVGDALCLFGWNWELDFIQDNRERITRQVEAQIRGAGVEGAFVMGSTYLTAEARLEAIDHFCEEVARVSREVGY